ncbi:ribulose-5-phosphate 4-epimerase-like epimerase or aldolase [Sphaerochaeta pleomorpha str. Grapes]|uniref:Ribulose-5-phosphate 4-epimerase-like epimerase or aldolase n=1 Tax=Sphaerochaeta pleomorpha (strain ATCC BAA-1885 / DSM 22778 / Grapes) TaxID=158190 RepID=G8QSY4_SPHPG|nr:class II aldolase/adducin family protein [Sphaerochaeta pleomorpha]AEV30166.1 ribulose-5-phosphate 4-epimerase-like epimerase or aldolase [Sphaerochaeta pleomorpha str. Grapes]
MMEIISQYADLVDSLILAARKMYSFRYEMSDGGNLSMRVPGKDWMIVKGTNVAFDEIAISSLVVTDFEGNVIEGSCKPSKESLLHGVLYSALPHVNAIMHCHSPYATAWASDHDSLAFSTHHAREKLNFCPVVDTHSYVVPREYFTTIVNLFQENENLKSFILRGHGQVTVGKTMREAVYLAELVEETAQISVLSQAMKYHDEKGF